jgi:hypothetical protein
MPGSSCGWFWSYPYEHNIGGAKYKAVIDLGNNVIITDLQSGTELPRFSLSRHGGRVPEVPPALFMAHDRLYCTAQFNVRFKGTKSVTFDVFDQAKEKIIEDNATAINLITIHGQPWIYHHPEAEGGPSRQSHLGQKVILVNALTGEKNAVEAKSLRGNISKFEFRGVEYLVWAGDNDLTIYDVDTGIQTVFPMQIGAAKAIQAFTYHGEIYAFVETVGGFPQVVRLTSAR